MALSPLFAATKGLAQVSSACRLASNEAAKVLESVPPERMRNFSVISHVDHGKSTLSDRLMELTGAIRSGGTQQYLDRLPVERDRGITVKAQTASILHSEAGDQFLLNLIDTPGHADFAYEVSRSLEACQGCLLLVDATQGVQAQTLANFYLALDKDLEIVPVLNKVDAASAEPEETALQMSSVFGLSEEEIIPVSAKTGWNVGEVLRQIVSRIPAPSEADPNLPARGLLLDSHYNSYRVSSSPYSSSDTEEETQPHSHSLLISLIATDKVNFLRSHPYDRAQSRLSMSRKESFTQASG